MMRVGAGIAVLGSGLVAINQVSGFVLTPISFCGRFPTTAEEMCQHKSASWQSVQALAMSNQGEAGDTWGTPAPPSSGSSGSSSDDKDWDDLSDEGGELDEVMAEVAGRKSGDTASGDSVMQKKSMPTMGRDGTVFTPAGLVQLNPFPDVDMDYDNIPGKMTLDAATLAEQQKGLEKMAQQLRRERLDREATDSILFGFCENAEIINCRFAMAGFAIGLLTEYWTGQSIPQQVETLFQVLGLLPLDYDSYFS